MSARCARTLLALLVLGLRLGTVAAHETRPAYLELTELADGAVQILWRQPVGAPNAVTLTPVLSSGWLAAAPQSRWLTQDSLTRGWRIAAPRVALAGQRLRIDGLDGTLADVLVRIRHASGRETTALLRPTQRELTLPAEGAAGRVVPAYFRLGLHHIFTGVDHLLYLLGLILLIRGWRPLLAAITAFTLAHSLTLGAASLGLARLDSAAVEAAIALSILYVAVELARGARGAPGLLQRRPWIVAFGFGLLHGFGFAGALRETGLPADAIVTALLSFNLGIETGQLLFAAAVLGLLAAAARWASPLRTGMLRVAPHAIGALAAYWLIERVLQLRA